MLMLYKANISIRQRKAKKSGSAKIYGRGKSLEAWREWFFYAKKRRIYETGAGAGTKRGRPYITKSYGRLCSSQRRTDHQWGVSWEIRRVPCGAQCTDPLHGRYCRGGSVCNFGAVLPSGQDTTVYGYHHWEKNRQSICGKHGFQSTGGRKRCTDPAGSWHLCRDRDPGRRMPEVKWSILSLHCDKDPFRGDEICHDTGWKNRLCHRRL